MLPVSAVSARAGATFEMTVEKAITPVTMPAVIRLLVSFLKKISHTFPFYVAALALFNYITKSTYRATAGLR